MTINGIVVIGENLLARELFTSLREHGVKNVELNDFHPADTINVVIETSNLDLAQKRSNLMEMEKQISPSCLILSTTLAVTATEAASWLAYPERLVGFGTFSNFKYGSLIEIAPALQTDSSVLEKAAELFALIRQGTEVVRDEAGLVFPRILSMIINEAAFTLSEGTASAEDIDEAMKKGTNYPLGPLEWADQIGLEDVYAVLRALHREMGEDRYRPAPLIRKLVYAGWTGGVTGMGFYYYQNRHMKGYSYERSCHN